MFFRTTLHVLGLVILTLAGSMALPLLADLHIGDENWQVFLLSMIASSFFGGLLALTNAADFSKITLRQGFLMVSLAWLCVSFFACLPFWFGDLNLSFTDSLFEAISGVTTTGSTILSGLDILPRGFLLWRAQLQWMGGIATIMMAVSVLPFLKVGGMEIFKAELSQSEKAMPRVRSLLVSICSIYLVLTIACALSYRIAGLTLFDSLTHAMTTISTGGFATSDQSFMRFGSTGPLLVAIIFMIAGGLPFILILKALKGDMRALWQDEQVRGFLIILIAASLSLAVYIMKRETLNVTGAQALLHGVFNAVSVMTGTGFFSLDYSEWSGYARGLFFFLMAIGACAGSTSSGIKVFRFQIMSAITRVQVRQLLYPSGVFPANYNGRSIPEDVPVSVMGYFFLYALCFAALACALAFLGLDFMTALSAAATSISNSGPGLGHIIGPAGNFSSLGDVAKWVLCAGMILGRLEFLPVLVLFSPYFWRR